MHFCTDGFEKRTRGGHGRKYRRFGRSTEHDSQMVVILDRRECACVVQEV
jgi:hypothetical protein